MATKKKTATRADGRKEIKRKMPDGKVRHFYGSSKAEAEQAYREALIGFEAGRQAEKRGKSFAEVATSYEDFITGPKSPLRRGTVTAYRKHIRPLREYFGDTPISDIDPQAVRGYLERMKAERKAQKTVNNAKSVLSCIFGYWCAEYHGDKNPVALAKLPSGLRKKKRTEPTPEQIKIIMEHPESYGFWAQLFAYTGMRLSEANALQWADVDFANGVIKIRKAAPWDGNTPYEERNKTENSVRDIPMLSVLRPQLEARQQGQKVTDYVLSGMGRPLTNTEYKRRWESYCRQIGLATPHPYDSTNKATGKTIHRVVWSADVTAHQFRHMFATMLFYSGVPDMVAQGYLGHADITTTRRIYQHLRASENAQYVAMIEDYITKK